jgi:lysophospholipase L1-like esterase
MRRLLIFIVFLGLAKSSLADPTPVKDGVDLRLEAFGDSLTAGFLSGTTLTAAPPLPEISDIISDMALFKLIKNPAVLVKLHRPDLAWPQLLAQLEGKRLSARVSVDNQAVSGAHVANLVSQVSRVRVSNETTQAYFFIGHNDLCNNPKEVTSLVGELINHYRVGLEAWDKTHEGGTAYLIPVAAIQDVYEVLHGYKWYTGPKVNYTCEDSWDKLFPYCRSYHRLYKTGKLEEYLIPRVRGINQGLEKLAEEWDRRSLRKNHFRFLKDFDRLSFRPEFFAVDCYHISPAVQRAIAEALYN